VSSSLLRLLGPLQLVEDGMGWGGALDMVVMLWLTEESEHVAGQTASEYGCFKDDGAWMDAAAVACSLLSLSVISGRSLLPPLAMIYYDNVPLFLLSLQDSVQIKFS